MATSTTKPATKPATKQPYSPAELKILFEALSIAPSYLSKRFVLKNLLGWSEEDLKINMMLIEQEKDLKNQGQRVGY